MDRLDIIPERVCGCFHTERRHQLPRLMNEVSIPVRVWSASRSALPLPSNLNDSG